MALIDIDDEFLELFFSITNAKVPKDVTLYDLKNQLVTVVETMQELNKNAKKPILFKNDVDAEIEEPKGPAILVIDDLGVITYQLKVLLSQFEMDVDCSQEIYDAVNKFKKRKYEYIIMDLFIPTEREGFILLTELKKMVMQNDLKTVIGVITASPRKDIEAQCRAKGADFFLEKNNNWQETLVDIMKKYISTDDDMEFDY